MQPGLLPPPILANRIAICGNCSCGVDFSDPCAACPKNKWGPDFCVPQPADIQQEQAYQEQYILNHKVDAVTDLEESERRYSICQSCEFFHDKTKSCKKCGCNLLWKIRKPREICPIGKWHGDDITKTQLSTAKPADGGPSLLKMAGNFALAMKDFAQSGFLKVTQEQYNARMDICNSCEFWQGDARMGMGKCLKCGCSGAKQWIATSVCPINKWGAISKEEVEASFKEKENAQAQETQSTVSQQADGGSQEPSPEAQG